jgi:predicted Ser/Thr protein kinase
VKAERWRQIDKICDDVLERPPEERALFLDQACAGDRSLRKEVEELLGSLDQTGSFLASPAIDALSNPRKLPKPGALAGRALGPYKLKTLLGAGGMGEVYLAVDTRLDREVAVKVLTPVLLGDPRSRARFLREARSVSRLNHPHICTLYDVGQQDGIDFLVMEYLDGETLASRLRQAPLPPDQALRYAIEIADALDHAHAQGITHRDLKPSNVMLTKSGTKLLDFGLAKLQKPAGAGDLTAQPTDITAAGAIMGTVQYMAPEQLHGKDVDSRTDVFAFGALLYEMITGRHAFRGDTQATLIAAILDQEPEPISSVEPALPVSLQRAIQTCLVKNPEDRWQTARDLRRQLQWISDEGGIEREATNAGAVAATSAWARSRSRKVVGAIAAVAFLLTAVVAIRHSFEPAASQPATVRFDLFPAQDSNLIWMIGLSPDGRNLAFIATAGKQNMIWIRSLDALAPQPLPGTEGAEAGFWSADRIHRFDFCQESDDRWWTSRHCL